MRRPNILDVVQAITEVAPAHPHVTTWWYAPNPELMVRGDRFEDRALEIVVETAAAGEAYLGGVASEISGQLSGQPVTVRMHRGSQEEKKLFRMLTLR